ncbi:zinc-ribbon and DUF3426 domain-containing protein [Paucibacter soli]|uniref:zinc-ribbon and DUF3426 domain-containing protein n=1 Tax=Paucibacter soli TaxID=3133433 RepID=UPI0030A101AD
MSLATRCTACGTIFRVVQDQLRVSDGWVRCGRCAEVFDAREQLFDMDREAPPPWPPQVLEQPPTEQAPPARPAPDEQATWVMPSDTRRPAAEPSAVDAPAEASPDPQLIRDEPAAAEDRREPYWEPEPPAEPEPEAPLQPPADDQDVVLAPSLAPSNAATAAPPGAAPLPSFLKHAEGRARWQRRPVRLALALGSGLLALGLTAQVLWHFRDAAAAIYPQALPQLRAACAQLGCEIKPWQRIDAISVESSALTLAASGNHYKLSLALRNKSGWELALPWVDLTLTDANGAIVARRALSPADFNLGKNSLAAGAEQGLQLVLSTGKQRVTGYTVEIFHP